MVVISRRRSSSDVAASAEAAMYYETTGGQILAGAGPDIPLWVPELEPEPDIITGE